MGKMKPHIYEVGEIVSEGTLRIIEQIRMKRGGNSIQKGYLVQSLTYPNAPLYEVTEGNLKQGTRDSYVLGINQGNLARVCREEKGTVGGYHWKYV